MNIVAIDPSLNSTAIVINNKRFSFVNKTIALTKKGKLTKWFEISKDHISYNYIEYFQSIDYSRNEMLKHKIYDDVATSIINIIKKNTIELEQTQIIIEGYSFSSNAGPLIDLVTFSTLLRNKLLTITDNIIIISPTSLKLEAAKFAYKPIEIGKKKKKLEYRNNKGLAGGKFQKIDMYEALIENSKEDSDYLKFLRDNYIIISKQASIPKPLDDINDAQLMYYIVKNNQI